MVKNVFVSRFRAIFRLSIYICLTLTVVPTMLIAVSSRARLAIVLPKFYHQLCLKTLGISINTMGNPSSLKPTLFVSNHLSYLDIAIIGSLLEVSFIAKAEISKWPIYGILARLTRTLFVERRGSFVGSQRDAIAKRLFKGDNLVLFPEGTSADGRHVLPFKSSLFAVAELHNEILPFQIQPVSIAYTKLDGLPLDRFLLPYLAWYGDMTLVPHFFKLAGLGAITVEVKFHTPILSDQFKTRKELAEYCHRIVSFGVASSNQGRKSKKPKGYTSAAFS